MRALVLGGGGREHALCWSLSHSPSIEHLTCAPGNAGIAEVAHVRAVDATDPAAVVELAREESADLVIVGPEAPLMAGVADALGEAGVPVFGPTAAAARIEGSKTFCKQVMEAAGVPTAGYWTGTSPEEAKAALDRFAPPYVVKADGLAAGKGVRICLERGRAEEAVHAAMVRRAFGPAGERVVIEEFLDGPEISVFALCDGQQVVPLAAAQDFKRALDGDRGRNTGGMGAYTPVPAIDDALLERITTETVQPVATELARRGSSYVGILYAGLVLTAEGPKVLEFNARFGDPEAQAVLPRLLGDLGAILASAAHGEFDRVTLDWDPRACVTVVLASGGYPGPHETGKPITGLGEAALSDDAIVFHAGTRREDDQILTAGGRVLAVSGLGDTVAQARAAAYRAADRINFDGLHRRDDIAVAPTGG